MALTAGERLGPYEIRAQIGEGGMGEVYRARDTRLARDVAVKILPHEFALDAKRRARFETEAKAASALQHPGILVVHDIGEQDGSLYLVTELIDGQTLRETLAAGPMTMRKAVDLASQIADALGAAHAAGIVHRDLKPDNVMVTREGRAKILDFGLAKTRVLPGLDDATIPALKTDSGMILGTIGYMSPEQVKASETDARSDIFSFGAMLYEMLSGKRPFVRQTAAESMTAILREDVEPLPPEVGASLARITERCLEKEPRRRFQSAGDLAFAIGNALSVPVSTAGVAVVAPRRRKPVWPVAAILVAFVAGAGLMWILRPPVVQQEYRYVPWAMESANEEKPSWSPDGKSIAYLIGGDVYIRGIDDTKSVRLTKGVGASPVAPVWSRDGSRVYYCKSNPSSIWAVTLTGGVAEKVMETPTIRWALGPDGKTLVAAQSSAKGGGLVVGTLGGNAFVPYTGAPLVKMNIIRELAIAPTGKRFAAVLARGQIGGGVNSESSSELWILPSPGEAGPPKQLLLNFTSGSSGLHVSWMPDSRRLLATVAKKGEAADLYLIDIETSGVTRLTRGLHDHRNPVVAPDGSKFAVEVDSSDRDILNLELGSGITQTLLATARQEWSPQWFRNGAQYAYLTNANGNREIWVRNVMEGTARPMLTARDVSGLGEIGIAFALSPDSERLALDVLGKEHFVAVWRIGAGAPVRLDATNPDHHEPVWSPDGQRIAFRTNVNGGICFAASSGNGKSTCLDGYSGRPAVWTPDGKWILARGPRDFTLVSMESGEKKRLPLLDGRGAITGSPDGKFLYLVHRLEGSQWGVEAIDRSTLQMRRLSTFQLPPQALVTDMSLHPDGKRAAITVSRTATDIVMLEAVEAAK